MQLKHKIFQSFHSLLQLDLIVAYLHCLRCRILEISALTADYAKSTIRGGNDINY